jgi:hypothetical protein
MIKLKLLRNVAAVAFLITASAHCQILSNDGMSARLDESHANLRKAIILLGEARLNSCKFNSNYDCELAKLSEMELALLDMETKYMRASRASHSQTQLDKFNKLKEAARTARDNISELAAQIDEALK